MEQYRRRAVDPVFADLHKTLRDACKDEDATLYQIVGPVADHISIAMCNSPPYVYALFRVENWRRLHFGEPIVDISDCLLV